MTEIRFSGFGGQGIVRCALIMGKALSIFDGKYATMTQSFGPEARGSACASQLVVSDDRVLYPYVNAPEILLALSQEAYSKYGGEIVPGGTIITDIDLVKTDHVFPDVTLYKVPATRFAEELGNRVFTNLVALGFFTAVTGVVSPDAMKKALPGLVPDRFLEINFKAFDKGHECGLEALAEEKKSASNKSAGKKAGKKKR